MVIYAGKWYKWKSHCAEETSLRGGEDMRVKLLGAIAIALLLVLMFAVVAQAAVPQSDHRRDHQGRRDGTIDGNWTPAEIRAALAYVRDNPTLPAV